MEEEINDHVEEEESESESETETDDREPEREENNYDHVQDFVRSASIFETEKVCNDFC